MEDNARARFEGRVGELVSADAPGRRKGEKIKGTHGGGTRT